MPDIDKLAWIHIENCKLLLTRSRGKQTYYLPGGKRQGSESDQAALTREVKEELNVDLVGDSLQLIGQFEAEAHGKPDVKVQMTCYSGRYQGCLKASSEIEEFTWLGHADKHQTSAVDIIIMDWLKDRQLID